MESVGVGRSRWGWAGGVKICMVEVKIEGINKNQVSFKLEPFYLDMSMM